MVCAVETQETRDKQIGTNIAALRGEVSQRDLATAMNARQVGRKWSQATVWAIERGDRRVQLVEAVDLARILAPALPLGAVLAEGIAGEVAAFQQASQSLSAGALENSEAAIVKVIQELQENLKSLRVIRGMMSVNGER